MRAHQNTWGESVTALGIGIHNLVSSLCEIYRGVGQGHLQMHRWLSMTLLHMHKGFPTLNEEADNCDVILWCHCHTADVIKGVLHEPQGWFSFAAVQFRSISVWEGDRLFVLANFVPLEEQEYKQIGKCSLFVHPSHMCPRLAWMPLVSFAELLVCQPGVSSPCDNQPGIGKARTTTGWTRNTLQE